MHLAVLLHCSCLLLSQVTRVACSTCCVSRAVLLVKKEGRPEPGLARRRLIVHLALVLLSLRGVACNIMMLISIGWRAMTPLAADQEPALHGSRCVSVRT